MGNSVAATARWYRKQVGSPPGFGIRGTGSTWYEHLRALDETGGFERGLTLAPHFETIERTIVTDGNPWGAHLRDWGLVGVTPTVLVSHPNPDMLASVAEERQARIAAEVQALAPGGDSDTALQAFKTDYEAATSELDRIAAASQPPPFLDAPPMSLDPFLDWRQEKVGEVDLVASTFPGLSGATVGLALRLDSLPQERWSDLAVLGALVAEVGVLDGDQPIPYSDVVQRLQRETYSVGAWVDARLEVGRPELVLRGTGTTLEEARAAIGWMTAFLFHADWRPENLPRLRDVIAEALQRTRNRPKGAEEGWVEDPGTAWRLQSDPLRFATASLFTREHLLLDLKWRLMPGDAAVRAEAAAVLEAISPADRAAAEGAVAALGSSEGAASDLLAAAALDLRAVLGQVPDATAGADVAEVARQMAAGLRSNPTTTLEGFRKTLDAVAVTGGARLWLVSDEAAAASLAPDIAALVAPLRTAALVVPDRTPRDHAVLRLGDHATVESPTYVHLVQPAMQGGVFTLSTPAPSYRDTDRESLLRYLAGLTYSGHGPHSLFMKTWGAGLAYSNGARPDVRTGRMRYYAERCPELPQTLRFVVDAMTDAAVDGPIAEYALALAFRTRSAHSYESRGAAIAVDLDEDLGPDVIRTFREALLALRDDADLAKLVGDRVPVVYGEVLPGLGTPSASVDGGVFFTIGPESQRALLEAHLRAVEGDDVVVHALFPRDYWWGADGG
jgi:hypothetical protein